MASASGITRRALVGAGAAAVVLPGQGGGHIVRPKPTDELLANPGMGWQTFHQFADSDRALAGLPSASAYFRFYWREVEPREGEVDFGRLDGLVDRAMKCGQRLAFRIMCTGSGEYCDTPDWLRQKGCRGIEYRYEGPSRHWAPDWEDRVFLDSHFRLIRDLGARYDGHPGLDLVDIGTVGLWGEWHMSGCTNVATGKPAPMPAVATRLRIIDAWRAAFPKTPTVMLIGDEPGMRHAISKGSGWRADCLGDMGGFSKTWNHMDHFYLQQLQKTGAQEAWQRAPVAFETCWDMRKWVQEGWDVRGIFDYALRCHASYVNNKSAPIPEGKRPEVERLLRRLGYRLVLQEAVLRTGPDGSSLPVRMRWANEGVAPPYGDWRIAFRIRRSGGSGVPFVHLTDVSVRGWLPGERSTESVVPVPAGLRRQALAVDVAVADPRSRRPSVRLAVSGSRPDGWLPLADLRHI